MKLTVLLPWQHTGFPNIRGISGHLWHSVSLRVAVPSPEEKQEGGNVYEKLTRIVSCDVKVNKLNKLYFPRKNVCTRAVLTQTK